MSNGRFLTQSFQTFSGGRRTGRGGEARGLDEKRDEERRQKTFLAEKDVLETGPGRAGRGEGGGGRVGSVGGSGMVLRGLCTLEQGH